MGLGDGMLKARGSKGKEEKQSVDILCLARPDGYVDRSENETHSGAWFNGDLDESSVTQFVRSCNKHQSLVIWGAEPKIVLKEKKPQKKKQTTNPAPKHEKSSASGPTPPSPRPQKEEKTKEVPDD